MIPPHISSQTDPESSEKAPSKLTRRAALQRTGWFGIAGTVAAAAGSGGRIDAQNRPPTVSQRLSRPFLEFFPQPFLLMGTRVGCILIREGRGGAFQDLVDATLNAAAGKKRFILSPLFPGMAVAGIFHFDAVKSSANQWGSLRYYEWSLSLILRDKEHPTKILIFNPFMILDDFYALIAGREIYGFPKVMGTFNATGFPDRVVGAQLGSLETVTARVNAHGFATETISEQAHGVEVLSTEVSPTGPPVTNVNKDTPDDFINKVEQPYQKPDWDLTKTYLSSLLNGVFLKQFPDCGAVSSTCYRSVILAPYHVLHLHQIRFGNGSVTFQDPASYPIATALGYRAGQAVSGLGFVADADWQLDPGQEI